MVYGWDPEVIDELERSRHYEEQHAFYAYQRAVNEHIEAKIVELAEWLTYAKELHDCDECAKQPDPVDEPPDIPEHWRK